MARRLTSLASRSSSHEEGPPAVFINCPFDADYADLFEAIFFTCVCCGFYPRSAIESASVSTPRVTRIYQALSQSQYSIHDLSRCTGEGSANLARFNMPLELGMAMALSQMRRNRHDWLVLVPEGHRYKQFVSDLAGFDPGAHDGTVERVVPVVAAWLFTRPDVVSTAVLPVDIIEALPLFHQEKTKLAQQWQGEPPWGESVAVAVKLAQTLSQDRRGGHRE